MVSGLFGMIGLPGIEDGAKAVFVAKKQYRQNYLKEVRKECKKEGGWKSKKLRGLIMRLRSGRSLYTMA